MQLLKGPSPLGYNLCTEKAKEERIVCSIIWHREHS